MLGDVLLITDKHREAGGIIIDHILKNKKDKMMIGISGESGSGKSELAHVIAKGLRKHGIFAKPIHIDNFYRILPLERTEWRKSHGIEKVVGYDEYDWTKIYKVIDDFRNGQISTMPCVDLVTEQVDQLTTDFQDVDMLVIDGLYSIKTDGLDDALIFRGNVYDSAADPGQWFAVGETMLSFEQWVKQSGEQGARKEKIKFPDAERGIETYMASLGKTPTFDVFVAEVRKQSKTNWHKEFTAPAINNWIREGFGVKKIPLSNEQ